MVHCIVHTMVHTMVHCTVHCKVHCMVHRMVHCIVHCIVHSMDVPDDAQAVHLATELADGVLRAPGADRAAVPRAVAEGLVQAALRLGSTDNVTVLVVWLVWEG